MGKKRNLSNNERSDTFIKKKKVDNINNLIITCPYLDTINRKHIDFDQAKECSISLLHNNLYMCLICGKYFQGRSQSSYAYQHAIQLNHHVYLKNLV